MGPEFGNMPKIEFVTIFPNQLENLCYALIHPYDSCSVTISIWHMAYGERLVYKYANYILK